MRRLRALGSPRERGACAVSPRSKAPKDVFAHRDGTVHAVEGPLGCPRCADLRRDVWNDLTKKQQMRIHKTAHAASVALKEFKP